MIFGEYSAYIYETKCVHFPQNINKKVSDKFVPSLNLSFYLYKLRRTHFIFYRRNVIHSALNPSLFIYLAKNLNEFHVSIYNYLLNIFDKFTQAYM